jgi:uncharacterized protein YjbI with pentapeptide repeats
MANPANDRINEGRALMDYAWREKLIMNGRRQNRLMVIQTLSSLVVAASVITLVRYRKDTDIPAPQPLSQGTTSNASDKADSSSEIRKLPLKMRLVRNAVNTAVVFGTIVTIVRSGSLEPPMGIGVMTAGIAMLVGWYFHTHWRTWRELLKGLLNSTLAAATIGGVVVAVATTDDLFTRLVLLFVAMILFGLMVWDSERNVPGSRSGLGAALLGGAVVAAAVFFGQFTIDDRVRTQDFQSTVAFNQDLTGVDLRHRDLSSLHLYGKIFKGGNLAFVNMANSYLVKANLTDAWMHKANLTDANLSEAVLEGATLSEATLTNADLTDVTKTSAVDLTKAVLQNANLTNADLHEVYLDGAVLVAARQDYSADDYFEGPNLSWTSLVNADLTRADLRKSNLSHADLTDAILRATDLTGADLTGATTDGAILEVRSLRGANLRGVDLRSTNLSAIPLETAVFDRETKWPKGFQPNAASVYLLKRGAQLRNANLAYMKLDSIDLRDSDLRKAHLFSADLSDSDLRRADLRNASFNEANLGGADLSDANLRGADLVGADLRSARLNNAQLRGANLVGADLRGARLNNAQLRGANAIPDTKWPRGFDPKSAGVNIVEPSE